MALYWARRLRRFSYTRQDFYLFSFSISDGMPQWLADNDPTAMPADVPIMFHVGREADLDDLSPLADAGKLRRMRQWLEDGHRVYIGSHGNKVVYYEWVAFRDFYDPFLRLTIPVGDEECFAFDAFTHPDYRLQNLLRAASSAIARDCYHEMGKRKILAYVNAERWPLFQKLYRVTGLGTVRPELLISRIRILGIWRGRMAALPM